MGTENKINPIDISNFKSTFANVIINKSNDTILIKIGRIIHTYIY